MINWKSILSSFNDKPTLLEWLKQVEKALKESVLTNVLTDTKNGKTAFTFKFEDGTEIKTDYIQTQGETGPRGATGPQGPRGIVGPQGISVISCDTIGSEVVGDETLTTIRAQYSDSSYSEFIVNAKNGKNGTSGGKLYLHYIIGSVSTNSFNFCLYTSSPEPINSNDKAFNVLNVGEYQNRIIPGYFKGDKKYCCGVIFDKSLGTPAVRVEYLSETGNNVVEEANINNDIVTEL